MHFLLCMRYTCSLVLIPYPFGLHRSLQYQTGSSFQYSRWILEKQLQSPVKQLLEVEYANGLTPYWNQYGFPRMKSPKSMKSVNTRLLFPWYGIRTDILPPYLGLGITFLFQSQYLCTVFPIPVAELCHGAVMLQGSTKSGILGEIFLNLSNFLNLVDPTAISLPLKRCNSGTVLQVCLSYYIFSFPKAIWTLLT